MTASDVSAPAGRTCLGMLLAAGEGTRMRSARAKPLHAVAGRSMLALRAGGAGRRRRGPDRGRRRAERRGTGRRGAAHRAAGARSMCRPSAAAPPMRFSPRARRSRAGSDDVIVSYARSAADPRRDAGGAARRARRGAGLVALGFEALDPTGYGRLVERDGALVAIREQKDASAEERAIRRCNAGPVAFSGARALAMLEAIGADNAAREYYLTDLVEIAARKGLRGARRARRGGRGDGRQRPHPARARRGGDAAAPENARDARRRDADCAGDGFSLDRHRRSAATSSSSRMS